MIPVGVLPPYRSGVAADPVWMTRFAATAEELGYESVYLVEHVVVPDGYAHRYPYAESGRMPLPDDCPIPDPLDLAAFLLARTERLVVATGIVVATHHHPLILAKRVATLSVLSGDRFRLGVGVGWMREELEATGVDWATRGARLDECIEAMQQVWRHDPAGFAGAHFSFERVRSHPRPSVEPAVHVGGHSAAAARRAGRLGAGYQPLGLDAEQLAVRLGEMAASADAAGRDPAGVEVTLAAALDTVTAEAVSELVALGASRVLLSARSQHPDEVFDELDAAARRLELV